LPRRRNHGTLIPMVEIADIKDAESLQAWLEETSQPQAACVALAHRAAMRVMPIVADYFMRTDQHSTLPVLRALLVSLGSGLIRATK
jgi:hypothetical protein